MREPVAVLLALMAVTPADAQRLANEGVEVQTLEETGDVQRLAAAAIDIRRRWPRATLVVAGPEQLTTRLRKRYPPAIDIAITSATVSAVLAAIVPP